MNTAENTLENTSTGLPTGRMAMWWFLASEVLIFGGLIACYILSRLHHPEWGAEAAHTVMLAGATNTVVLLTSSLTVVLAHHEAHLGNLSKASRLINITLFFGFIFLIIKSYEYTHEIQAGFTPITNTFWAYYFLMTGLHAAHVIAGMTALFIVKLGIDKNENPQRVEYAGMYWHLVDIIWIFLFPLLYIAS
jgi:heme/copper-type cytochrome/quinol oxidase subunit 3